MTRRAAALILLAGSLACAGPAPEPARLRVATSGDYAPFSQLGPDGSLRGFDVELASGFAADNGLALELVRFRWPELLGDLGAKHFDVAMSGVTVRPERSVAGRFSVPVVEGGAVALVADPRRFDAIDALDATGIRVAVNEGGHLERVTRARFPRATILTLPNDAVPDAIAAGQADAVVTDVFEAPYWRRRLPDAKPLGPFTRDRKAFLLPPERAALARQLDGWLLAREADGTLERLRARSPGLEQAGPIARPLEALIAAIDERLALMPVVAEAKRRAGLPVRAPEREERVLAAAQTAVRDAAAEVGLAEPPPAAVRRLFEAQIAAARAIQQAVLAGPAAPQEPPDLDSELRPALLRIGERIAWLIVRLPVDLEPARARRLALAGISAPHLPAVRREAIADALGELVER